MTYLRVYDRTRTTRASLPHTMGSLYDTLQAEFCPPLDTSLLAALIADLEHTDSGDNLGPSPEQVEALRATLRQLAAQAAEQYENELCDELDSAHLSSQCLTTDESGSIHDFYGETTESSNASDSSVFSHQSFSSPLGFLQAALPHIPPSKLRRALSDAGAGDAGDFDMEAVVESLLTNEYLRELEERGLDGLDDQSPLSFGDESIWHRVESKKKVVSVKGKAAKKKNVRGKTITLVDIRQKQHMPATSTNGTLATPDPWTQLSSLSEHLATLLPPHPASFFQSYFHSPNHSSPAKALRAALSSIVGERSQSSPGSDTPVLFTMLDVIRDSPTYQSLDAEQRSTLYSDAQLALAATRGLGDDAIDVVWLLLELDLDLESGSLAMGVYHLPQSPMSPTSASAWISPIASPTSPKAANPFINGTMKLPSGPPQTQPPPTSKRKPVSPTTSPTTHKPSPFEWQTVPQKPPSHGVHPLALHIPAYNNKRPAGSGKVRGAGNGLGKGGTGDVGELSRPDLRRRMAESLRKRDELLKEASKAWSRGNSKTRGGEVALYFADRAREFQELARREALNEARIMVESKRYSAPDRSTIDLHGTCVSEAVVIVKEILEREGSSTVRPLRIITGRGTHSANGVGVLKPAVRSALLRDGWNVGVWDGGLVVRGRTSITV
ncbi:hypothetical protein HYDPIDRAFT_181531 [Hydnomerulius pinastri MD-312]|uniref:Smr domain-containing protein n=1 Tax=Hydnomerulius pinastri MD-312 TaxID=994086 RepID=A0A0C9WGD0_9AGAM|nr:hypothetical protein HYDPIDRAFT_181531 [Hydnomerulius pinastri MD-312]